MKIYKYTLTSVIENIRTHAGAKVLHVYTQENCGQVWLLVDVTAPTVERTFMVWPTGQEIPEGLTEGYVGTFHLVDTVWHVFDLGEGE